MVNVMMFKGTPGQYSYRQSYMDKNEWEVYPLRDGPPDIGDWAEICTCKDQYRDDGNGADEAQYNAILFAAAPELLEELIRAANDLDYLGYNVSSARAAISKALGDDK